MSSEDLYHDDPIEDHKSRASGKISGLLALILTVFGSGFYLQTTLAPNVSINSGNLIEFGQGSARTVACSGATPLLITPMSSFVNDTEGIGAHRFASIKVSNIPVSCRGQDLAFSAYNNESGSSAQALFNASRTRAVIAIRDDDTYEVGLGGRGLSVVTNSASSFTVTFTSPIVLSSNIFNLTVESIAHQNFVPMVTSGDYQSCALLDAGTVKCFGKNQLGQLGDGSDTTRTSAVFVRSSSVDASPLANVAMLASGTEHSCALLDSGTVKCWGMNYDGQLGDQTLTSKSYPIDVNTLTNVSAISGGARHTCALLITGAGRCWGINSKGELGNNATLGQRQTPWGAITSVNNLADATAISVGTYSTCALLRSGSVQCWGQNTNGQLGDGSTSDRKSPVSVKSLTTDASPITNIIAISSGYLHACAILNVGTIKCWGKNTNGQLGDGTTTQRTSPVFVTGISNAVAITSGGSHTCALLDTGTMKCWGLNDYGQLGDGTTTQRTTPVSVAGLSNVAAISSGLAHTCASLDDGSVKCWGRNDNGQLGDGTTTSPRTSPVNASGFP